MQPEPSTSHVEQQIQARIAAARVRVPAARQRRDELSAARRRGLAEAEQRQDDEPEENRT